MRLIDSGNVPKDYVLHERWHDMDVRRKGYLFFLCVGMIVSAFLSLFVTWGQITLSDMVPDSARFEKPVTDPLPSMVFAFLSGQNFPVTGLSGRITTWGVEIPYWISALSVVSSSIMILMNVYKLDEFPILLVMALYGVAAIIVVWGGTEIAMYGRLSLSFLLACIGPIAGLGLAWYLEPQRESRTIINE